MWNGPFQNDILMDYSSLMHKCVYHFNVAAGGKGTSITLYTAG